LFVFFITPSTAGVCLLSGPYKSTANILESQMTLVYGFPLDENNVMDSIFNYNTFSVYIRQSL